MRPQTSRFHPQWKHDVGERIQRRHLFVFSPHKPDAVAQKFSKYTAPTLIRPL